MASLLITSEGPFVVLDGLFEDLTSSYIPQWDGSGLVDSTMFYSGDHVYITASKTTDVSDLRLQVEHAIIFDAYNGGTPVPLATIFDAYNSNLDPRITVGMNDTFRGAFYAYGGGVGVEYGGTVLTYLSADYDTSIQYYLFAPFHDELYIGSSADVDIVKIDANKDVHITAGSLVLPASEYCNFGGTQGTTGYGQRDNAGQIEVKDSGGTWREVKGIAVGGYYFNSTGVNPATELGYGTWTQVAKGQFLIGAT